MNKWFKILLGLIVLLGIISFAWFSSDFGSFWNFKHAAWEFLKGGFFWFVALIGLVLIVLGISELRE
jgi:uncharacterized membrane protein